MRLIYNSDAQRLQKNFDDKTPVTVSELFRSERTASVPIELFLVDNDGGYATPGSSDYEVLIGRQAQAVTTGKLTLTFTGTTEEIDLSKPKLATRIEAALNAVSEVNAAGGVDVVELKNGRAFQITFRSVGSRAAITAGVKDSMQPASVLISEVTAGTGSTREVQLLTLEEASLAEVSTSGWSANSNPALTITTLVEGTANTREVVQLSVSNDPAPGSFFVVSNSEPISTEATAAQVKTILNSALSNDIGSVKKTGERIWQITYKTNGDKTALSAGTHNLVKRPSVNATLSLNTTALAYAANSDGSDLSVGFTLKKSNEVLLSENVDLAEPFAEVIGSSAMLNNDSLGALFTIAGDDVNKGTAISLSGGLTYSSDTLAAPFLPLAGGTMSGPVAMGSQKITGLADGTASGDAINKGQLDGLIDNAPDALNTLNELAAALGDDVNFSTTVATNIATKLPKDGSQAMTGALPLDTGTAAAPSLKFFGDSDTGVFHAAANEIGFSTGGTEAARFDSSGRLGIGCTPTARLEITTASQGDTALQVGYTNSLPNLTVGTTTGSTKLEIANGNYHHKFYSRNASGTAVERLTIEGGSDTGDIKIINSNLGIGGTPSEKLTVDTGNIQLTNGNYIIFDGPTPKQTKMRSYYDGQTHLAMTVANSSVLDLTSGGCQITGSLTAGTGIELHTSGTNNFLSSQESANNFTIRNTATNKDIIFQVSDGSLTELLRLDGSTSSINIPNDIQLRIGGANDIRIVSESSVNRFNFYNHNTDFRSLTDNTDIIFKTTTGGTTSEILRLDASASSINVPDDVNLIFGGDSDLKIYHSSTSNESFVQNVTGNFNLNNTSNGDDLILRQSNSSGTLENYIQLDGGGRITRSYRNFRVQDGVKLQAGSSGLLDIYSDGTDSYIDEAGTGDLYVRSNNLRLANADGSGQFINANNGGNVELFYNNTVKVRTLNTGCRIIGILNTDTVNNAANSANIIYRSGTNTIVGNHANALVVQDSGNVAIGNTSASAKLDIRQDSGTAIRCEDGSGGYFVVNHGGSTGIGTTSPNALLNVQGDSDPTILINAITGNSANSGKLAFAETDGGAHQAFIKYDGSANRLEIGTADVAQAFLIDRTNGNIQQNFINYTDGSNYEALKISAGASSIKFDTTSVGSFSSNTRPIEFLINGNAKGSITNAGVYTQGNFYIASTGSLRNTTNNLLLTTSSQSDNDIIFNPNDTEAARITTDYFRFRDSSGKAVQIQASVGNEARILANNQDHGTALNLVISSEQLKIKTDQGAVHSATFDETGDLELLTDGKGLILSSPDGTRYKITVANDGTVTSTAV